MEFKSGPFEVSDRGFVIATNNSELAETLDHVLCDLRGHPSVAIHTTFTVLFRGNEATANPWGVWRDGEPCETFVAGDYILSYIVWEITKWVFESGDGHLPLHASAAELGGRCVVFPGRTHSGKSTLAAWLTANGWGYLTDEAAIVDPQSMTVAPFHRPIGVRHPGPLDRIPQIGADGRADSLVPASALGRVSGGADLHALVFIRLGCDEPAELVEITPAAALAELALHHPALAAGGRTSFRQLANIVGHVQSYQLVVTDLTASERLLRKLVLEG